MRVREMQKKKRNILYGVCVFIMVIPLVLAQQPALPTTIYGKVKTSEGSLVSGIEVIAIWTDTDGVKRTLSTATLSESQAFAKGDKDLAGFYLFNQGYLKARKNTQVEIIIDGVFFENVNANPGGVIKVKDSTLGSSGSTLSSSDTETGEGGAGQNGMETPGGSGTPGDGSTGQAGFQKGNTPGEGPITGQTPGEGGTPSNQNQFPTGPDLTSTDTTQYLENTAPPALPTSVYGQVLDEKGKPVAGELVTAEFEDEYGVKREATTTTLSEEEARQLGDKRFEGYFLFTGGEIQAKQGTEINLKTQERVARTLVQSDPGGTKKVGTLVVFGESSKKPERTITAPIVNVTRRIGFDHLREPAKKAGKALLYLVSFILVFAFLIWGYRKYEKRRAAMDVIFQKSITSLSRMKLELFMTKNVITITKDRTLADAISTMVTNNVNSLVVIDGKKPAGIITEDDFLETVYYDNDFTTIKVGTVMGAPLIKAEGKTPFAKGVIFMLKNHVRKLPLTKKGELVGIITMTDILRVLNAFFSRNMPKSTNTPLVRSAFKKNVVQVTQNDSFVSVCDLLLRAGIGCAIVYDVHPDVSPHGRALGIITTKDILEELYNNKYRVSKLTAKHVMKTPIITTTPGTDVFEANKLMLSKKFRRLPVVSEKKVVGIFTQDKMLESLYQLLRRLKKE